jgi:hypothetical protein
VSAGVQNKYMIFFGEKTLPLPLPLPLPLGRMEGLFSCLHHSKNKQVQEIKKETQKCEDDHEAEPTITNKRLTF